MKSLLYLMRRHKLASALNLLGIGLALATFYLFMTQVEYNTTYNHGLKDYERTFRLEQCGVFSTDTWNEANCRPMAVMLEDIPHVEDITTFVSPSFGGCIHVEVDGNPFDVACSTMDNHGLAFFGSTMLYGKYEDWQSIWTAIITRSEAKRIFGKEDAVGERLKNIKSNHEYTIVGVCEDFPQNCTMKNGIYLCLGNTNIDSYEEWSYGIFVRLDDTANKEAVEKAYRDMILSKHFEDDPESGAYFHIRLSPMGDIYMSGVCAQDKGNSKLVAVLFVASFFILIAALLNFINFSLAVTPLRIRSLNTRKVMGASTAGLRFGIVWESVLQTMIALGIAVLLILGFRSIPDCMNLVAGSIDFTEHVLLSGATLAAALLIGILAALYPAWYSTSFKPAMMLKGSFGLSPRGKQLRTVMLLLQFTVAFILTTYLFIMFSQSHYIFNCDYGFAKDEVIFSNDLSGESMQKKDAIQQEVEKLPCVKSTAFGMSELGALDSFMGWTRGDRTERNYISLNVIIVDENYLRTMGVNIAEGRDFYATEPNGAWIVNSCMMRMYPWLKLNEPIGSWGSVDFDIVGVCEEFKAKSMRQDNSNTPIGFVVINNEDDKWWNSRCNKFFVRIAAGYDKLEARQQVLEAIRKIDDTWNDDMRFLDQKLQSTYAEEFRFISQVEFFAGISIIITLIGVFCQTMFETEYRRKEIAIRKILGSSVAQIVLLFAGKYMVPLAVSFLFAAPLSYNIGRQWLENFAEHTPIHWWIFPASFVSVCAVVLVTVIVQCFKVATTNPIESIRTE